MHDDQLRNLLRTLEEPRDPDPAFADALFNRLGMVARNRRPSRAPVILLAATIGLVVLGAGFAIGSGLVTLPITAEASATPSPSSPPSPSPVPSVSGEPTATPPVSASPDATPQPDSSDTPTPTPTPTPDQAAALGIPPGLLPPGAVVTVTGDGVRIRSEPTTSAEIVATMSAGDSAYVESTPFAGPVAADGYNWYLMSHAGGEDVWPWQDVAPDGYVNGWVAAGNGTQRYVALAEVACPTDPITLEVLAFGLTDWERLVCLSRTTVTFEAADFCSQFFGSCGEVTPGLQPGWLADVVQHRPMVLPGNALYPYVRVAIPPELVPTYEDIPEGRVLRVTLRIDDPAAATCVISAQADGRTADPDLVQAFCRERLVLESFEDIGENDL